MAHDSALRVEHELFLRSFFPVPPPERVARQLVARMVTAEMRPGDVLFRRGEPSTNVYMVIDGEVLMEAPGEEPWHFGPRSMLGVADATLERDHLRTARVIHRSQVVSIDFDEYRSVLEDNFHFTMSSLVRAVTNIHEQASQLPSDLVFGEADLGQAPDSPGQLNTIERLLVLRSVAMFKDGPVQPLVDLARVARQVNLSEGAKLLGKGDRQDSLYIVASGGVRVRRRDPALDANFNPGSIVGSPAMLGYDAAPFHMMAASPTSVLRLPKEDLYDIMEDQFVFVGEFFGWIATDNYRARTALADMKRAETDDLARVEQLPA